MSTIKCPRVDNYYNTNRQFGFNFCSNRMSRLQFSSEYESDIHLQKITPSLNYFNEKMKNLYRPTQRIVNGQISSSFMRNINT